MTTFTQASRPIAVKTPLGRDVLLLVGFTVKEAVSNLFSFELELLAEDKSKVKFEKLLGQKITVALALPEDKERYFSGVCKSVSQGARDETFTQYRMEVVPQLWFLTRTARSRIFQHLTVPDILQQVFKGLDVSFQLKGEFHPRDFCVQYRETDFNFASRLMEEEGIFYFFKHTANDHQLIVANTPGSHPELEKESTIIYDEVTGGQREEDRIYAWEKTQDLRTSKYTLWDHCFEMPNKNLEAQVTTLEQVQAGSVTHRLRVGANDKFEIYDYPGAYAQRFDGVDKGGGDQSSDLSLITKDSERTTKIRMDQETLPSLLIRGRSGCGQFASGHKFYLKRHFDANDEYVLTAVNHTARFTGYRSDEDEFVYENDFTCIPLALPFVPPQVAIKPTVHGTQTAIVVGPPGEEIFTDKYSRVKIQFNWDREGKSNADSSCWVRVSTLWAGKQWGVIHIPRIGQEVIVDFLEGDPDQPIVVGSVYNAEQMPPYALPANKTQSGIKSRSSKGGGAANFNEFRFEDKKGQEQVYLHAEKNQDIVVENDETHSVGHDRTKTIGHDETTHVKHDRTETVDNIETITIGVDRNETVGNNETLEVAMMRTHTIGINEMITIGVNQALTVGAMREVDIGVNQTISVGVNQSVSIGNNLSEDVGKDRSTAIGKNDSLEVGKNRTAQVGKNDNLDVGKNLTIVAGDQITLQTGQSKIVMKKNGQIEISGMKITIKGTQSIVNNAATITSEASAIHTIKGSLVKIN